MATTKPALPLRVSPELRQRIVERAKDEGITINALCERGLTVFLDYLSTSNEENTTS